MDWICARTCLASACFDWTDGEAAAPAAKKEAAARAIRNAEKERVSLSRSDKNRLDGIDASAGWGTRRSHKPGMVTGPSDGAQTDPSGPAVSSSEGPC